MDIKFGGFNISGASGGVSGNLGAISNKMCGLSLSGFFSLLTGSYKNNNISATIFTEELKYEQGFAEHYNKILQPHVEKFEERRVKALDSASLIARIAVPVLVVITLFSFYFLKFNVGGVEKDYRLAVIFVSFVISYALVNLPLRAHKNSIKSEIFPNILSFLGDYKYYPQCNVNKKDVIDSTKDTKVSINHNESNKDNEANVSVSVRKYLDSKIIPKFDSEHNEDYISGLYKDVGIELFETTLQKECYDNDDQTVFKGIFISLTMHKSFSGLTVVKTDFGKLGNWLKDKFSNLQNVKLEDPKFEKLLEVYSTDQIEARYLLTTSFMERIIMLKESFDGADLQCSFYNDKLLIMIPVRKNLFEPGSIFEPEDFVDDAKILLREMNLIFSIINILKLYQNVGI